MYDGFKGDDVNLPAINLPVAVEICWKTCEIFAGGGPRGARRVGQASTEEKLIKKYDMFQNCARHQQNKKVIDKIKTFVILGLLCFMESVLVHPGNESL